MRAHTGSFCSLNSVFSLRAKLTIIFRGTGQVLKPEERAGWHKDVHVRFQKKAWADDEFCEDFAADEMKEATEAARARSERSVVFVDNLSGQTTDAHKSLLKKHAKCDRHLLPTGSTGELMLIDGGIGVRLKNLMGEEMDAWLEQEGHLERWTKGPKEGGLQAWEKRVLITLLAARAWDTLCATYDFEASATALGLRMTLDGTGDEKIKIQGVEEAYSFTDSDGGPKGGESDAEEDPTENADVDAATDNADVAAAADTDAASEGEEAEDGVDSSDEEDDTTPQMEACDDAPTKPPDGFAYAPCPLLNTLADKDALVGRKVLVARIDEGIEGWYVGTVVKSKLTMADKRAVPGATHAIEFKLKETRVHALQGKVAIELSAAKYGPSQWWLLLEPAITPAAAEPSTPADAPTDAAPTAAAATPTANTPTTPTDDATPASGSGSASPSTSTANEPSIEAIESAVRSILDGPDEGQLSYRMIREGVEAKLGLPNGSLKSDKAKIREIIDRINDEMEP